MIFGSFTSISSSLQRYRDGSFLSWNFLQCCINFHLFFSSFTFLWNSFSHFLPVSYFFSFFFRKIKVVSTFALVSLCETSLCYKNRPKIRVFRQKKVEKKYETGKKCEKSFIKKVKLEKKKWNYETVKKFQERKLPPQNCCIEDNLDVKKPKIFD